MTQAENQAVIKRARDILVGKVPMPMEQCHEITKALIYKFISVSDQASVADGDAPFYFCGAAQDYRWDALLSMRLPADAIASRYRDGLAHIGGRRDIPQAFQGIYQDAALPCDDAPTVAAFLRAVDAFDTANPETIGDAFEHLLQDTGAQGKAGQFRTPRHIIDFIVAIVNPQSRETILDPACGTAGFLTAAWRHIQRQEGAALTIPDRNRVAGRLVGYDLAPDMVKLASVNLFLQHNQEPRVEVYDTVSHDAHWNDHYDVILANPPFMSPAGIIKPHSRFCSILLGEMLRPQFRGDATLGIPLISRHHHYAAGTGIPLRTVLDVNIDDPSAVGQRRIVTHYPLAPFLEPAIGHRIQRHYSSFSCAAEYRI